MLPRNPVPLPSPTRQRLRRPRRCSLRCATLVTVAALSSACGKGEEAAPARAEKSVREVAPLPGVGPKRFVNTKEALVAAAPELTTHFLPFSFDVPEGWSYEEGGSKPPGSNFVKVERRSSPRTTAENFSVGVFWTSAPPGPIPDDVLTAKLGKFKKTIERSIPGAKILADVAMTFDGRRARGFRFATQAPAEHTGGEPLDGWGLVLFVPDVSGSDGAVLIMMGTAADGRFTSAEDVGVKGDLPRLIASFKFGR